MKKLMFAAVACAAMTGLAVESKNIVGYAGYQLRDVGSTMSAAMFMDITSSDGSIKLGNIVPIKSNGEIAGWWEVEIQIPAYDGSTDPNADYMWNGEGWENGDFEPMDDVVIPVGQGLWVINSTSSSVSFRSSGQVNENDALFALREIGSTAAANSFPTAITLGDIVPMLATGGVPGWWEVEIQIPAYDGSTDPNADYMWNGEGWENGDFEPMDDVDIPAGQGLWVINSTSAAVNLQIPAPEL